MNKLEKRKRRNLRLTLVEIILTSLFGIIMFIQGIFMLFEGLIIYALLYYFLGLLAAIYVKLTVIAHFQYDTLLCLRSKNERM